MMNSCGSVLNRTDSPTFPGLVALVTHEDFTGAAIQKGYPDEDVAAGDVAPTIMNYCSTRNPIFDVPDDQTYEK